MKRGRPLQRIPYGTLPCTLGRHLAPHDQFPRTQSGHVDSWCKPCRRDYDRKASAIRRRAERQARAIGG